MSLSCPADDQALVTAIHNAVTRAWSGGRFSLLLENPYPLQGRSVF